MQVVIVESPAKAKTINKYLGSGYKVLASYGHIRDLPPKDGSVRPSEDFAMDWEVDAGSQKHLKEIMAAVTLMPGADAEGEELVAYARERVAAYKFPRRVVIVEALPLGPSGKVLKRELVARFEAESAPAS